MRAPVQKCGNVARALRDGHYLDGAALGPINNDVSIDRPEQHRIPGEIFALMAHAWGLPESFESVEEFAYPAVGGVDVVPGDVFPDIIQVKVSIGAKDVVAHAPDFRRASDLRRSLARASAGSMCWPRSSASRRRAEFMVELRKLASPRLVVFLQEPERFADNLARGVVAARFHLGANELLQFGCEGNIHVYQYSFNAEDCQCLA